MPFQNVRKKVTFENADAGLSAGEVLFQMKELRLPAKNSLLRSGFATSESSDFFSGDGITVHFFKKNTNELGPEYGADDITYAEWDENEFLGSVHINSSGQTEAQINSLRVARLTVYGDEGIGTGVGNDLNLALSSAGADGIIYFTAIVGSLVATGPVISAGDNLDFNFSFEY